METWFPFMVIPQRIYLDHGRNFVSALISEYCKMNRIAKSRTKLAMLPATDSVSDLIGCCKVFLDHYKLVTRGDDQSICLNFQ